MIIRFTASNEAIPAYVMNKCVNFPGVFFNSDDNELLNKLAERLSTKFFDNYFDEYIHEMMPYDDREYEEYEEDYYDLIQYNWEVIGK